MLAANVNCFCAISKCNKIGEIMHLNYEKSSEK